MVASFQRVIGDEIRAQFMKREDRLPDAVLVCGSGGSNALGALKLSWTTRMSGPTSSCTHGLYVAMAG